MTISAYYLVYAILLLYFYFITHKFHKYETLHFA